MVLLEKGLSGTVRVLHVYTKKIYKFTHTEFYESICSWRSRPLRRCAQTSAPALAPKAFKRRWVQPKRAQWK